MLKNYKLDIEEQIKRQKKEKMDDLVNQKMKFKQEINSITEKNKKEDLETQKYEKIKYMTYGEDLRKQILEKKMNRKRDSMNNVERSMNADFIKGFMNRSSL